VKIYVAAVEALSKKQVFFELYPAYDQTQVTGAAAIIFSPCGYLHYLHGI